MIPIVKPFLPPREVLIPELENTLYSGYIAQGEKVEAFENALSNYFQCRNVLTLNSGTAALHLALILCNVAYGDEVISTPMTAEPTNTTIKLTGAKIVWADVDETSGLINPKSIRDRITNKTKVIVIVHYAGMVANMNEIREISKEFDIPVIEDCAHAFGAEYKNQKLGFFSDYAIYSLQAIKHITTVDGGILITRSKKDYERAKLLRWFGLNKSKSRKENRISEPGYKYHMNDVNATIGICQLRYLPDNVQHYIDNGKFLDQYITNPKLTIPKHNKDTKPSYWLYTITTKNRASLIEYLKEQGFDSGPIHLRNDLHPIFEYSDKLKGLDSFYSSYLHIGIGPWVTEHRERLVEVLNKY